MKLIKEVVPTSECTGCFYMGMIGLSHGKLCDRPNGLICYVDETDKDDESIIKRTYYIFIKVNPELNKNIKVL
jgi:hypothetical protein